MARILYRVMSQVRETLARAADRRRHKLNLRDIAQIQARVALLPVLDDRSPDEILGYGDGADPFISE